MERENKSEPRSAVHLTGGRTAPLEGGSRAVCRAHTSPAGPVPQLLCSGLRASQRAGRGDLSLELQEASGASPTRGSSLFQGSILHPCRGPSSLRTLWVPGKRALADGGKGDRRDVVGEDGSGISTQVFTLSKGRPPL